MSPWSRGPRACEPPHWSRHDRLPATSGRRRCLNGLANPLRVYFWMLGQDARLGLLTQGGFEKMGPSLYRRGKLWLHQLGLSLPAEGILYSRADGRFYRVPSATLPPEPPDGSIALSFRRGWEWLQPHLADYENWVASQLPDHRKRLLRICPPLLRPMRKKWRQAFANLSKIEVHP